MMLVGRCKNIITSQSSHHRLNVDSFRGQYQCTRTSTREGDGRYIYPTHSSCRLAVASSPDSLLVLRGHQGGSGRQRLHQVQCRQAQVQGQEDIARAPGADAADAAAGAAATPATPATCSRIRRGRSLHRPPGSSTGPQDKPLIYYVYPKNTHIITKVYHCKKRYGTNP